MSSQTPIISLQNLEYRYDKTPCISIPELDIYKGEILGLTGANGSGKSTLMNILAMLHAPTRGIMLYNGGKVSPKTHGHLRREITMLPQNIFLLGRSVADNITYGIKIRTTLLNRPTKSNLREQTAEALNLVGLAPEFMHRSWRALSGGEAQRVALAARLVLKPKVLILDEPTASLDEESSNIIAESLKKVSKSQEISIIIASHDHEWLTPLASRSVHMRHGKIK